MERMAICMSQCLLLILFEEEAALVRTCAILEQITGRKPVGYRAPLWEVNPGSAALLARHGLLYDSSLMDDDRPYTFSTEGRRSGTNSRALDERRLGAVRVFV